MALVFEWSDEALRNLESLINYLENNWEEKVIQKFFKRLESILETIIIYPNACRLVVKRKGIRKAVIVAQVSIYYQTKNSSI